MFKIILFIFCCFISITAFGDDTTKKMVYEHLQKLTPLKLYDGNIELIGEDQFAKQELAQWVKLLLTKTKTLFGSSIKFQNHKIRLVIKSETSDDQPFVTTSIFNGKILQRLVITDVNNFDLQLLELLLAEIFIKGYVYDGIPKSSLLSYSDVKIPYWLKMGLARNFYNSYKENDSEEAYMAWINGQIPPLRNIFEDNLWSTYISGIFFNSIRRKSNSREKFNKIFIAVADDSDIDYFWFQENIFEIGDNDFLIFWDNCFYIQKHMVYIPRKDLNDFERYLLHQSLFTFQGYSGIPVDDILPEAMSPIMIIQYKDELWINNYIDSKTRQLQVSATGKSEQYRKITNKICEYIENINSDIKLKDQILQYRDIKDAINKSKNLEDNTEKTIILND